MPSIALPLDPVIKGAVPRLLDWGGTLTPTGGGTAQRLDRAGSRHAIDLTFPPMPAEPTARLWVSKLKQAKRQGAIARFLQPGFWIGSPGAPRIDGAGQAGTTLALKGLQPGYCVRDGQWFTIVTAGRRYIYSTASAAIAGSDGRAAFLIEPPLRVSPVNDDVVKFTPEIEGLLEGNELAWEHLTAPWVELGTIRITECE